jgi:repressor LexA
MFYIIEQTFDRPIMARTPALDMEYLRRLQDYYAQHRVFPSYAAIGRIVGLNSTSSVSALLQRLRAAGYLEIEDRRLRPGARFFERPVAGSRIAAGLPALAFDAYCEGLAIDAHLVRHPSRTFLVTVKGDSMIGAGLLPGDTLIVETTSVANHGDIVIAMIDGAHTVKRLAHENRRFVLKPENPRYPVLRPEPLEIIGRIVGSFRKY